MNPNDPNGDPGTGAGMDAGGLIGALVMAGASVYGSYQSRQNTKDTIAANKEQSEYAYSKDLEMWNRQNEYNSPANQMARLKAAGLNPNLIYGSSANTGNATQLPKFNAPTIDYSGRRPWIDLPSMISIYQDMKIKQAQVDNLRAMEQNTRARTITEAARNSLVGNQANYSAWKLQKDEYLRPYQAAIVANQANASEAKLQMDWKKLAQMDQETLKKDLTNEYIKKQISGQSIENEKKQAELLYLQYRNEWTKMGVTSQDHVLLRIFVRMLNETGIDLTGGN